MFARTLRIYHLQSTNFQFRGMQRSAVGLFRRQLFPIVKHSIRYNSTKKDNELFIPDILFENSDPLPSMNHQQASEFSDTNNEPSPLTMYEKILNNYDDNDRKNMRYSGDKTKRDHISNENSRDEGPIVFDIPGEGPMKLEVPERNPFDRSLIDNDDENPSMAPEQGDASSERALFDEVFNKVFEKYNQQGKFNNELKPALEFSWQDSLKTTQNKVERHISLAMLLKSGSRLSQDSIDDMFDKFATALEPTLELLRQKESRKELIEFLLVIFKRFKEGDFKKQNFALVLSKDESLHAFTQRYHQFSGEVRSMSEDNSQEPLLCAYTIPLIFNEVIELLYSKFYDGQLALTLFNFLKKDLSLYLVCCNNDTYNKILKLHWVYYGKSSMIDVEQTFMEMINNGFPGNLNTYKIMREILLQYHLAKLGKGDKMPFFLKGDDKRAKGLERKLGGLLQQLRLLNYE